eukprot:gene14063-20006_t
MADKDEDELGSGGALLISVDELGLTGLWSSLKEDKGVKKMYDDKIVYDLSPHPKNGVKKVYDKIVDDFSPKKRERVVRLDLPHRAYDARSTSILAFGLDDLDTSLRDCVNSSFDLRQVAYLDEIKKLLNDRLEPTWNFATFYLVKDSFALMLEGRPIDVADRGLHFIRSMRSVIASTTKSSTNTPALFQEAWVFTACLALAQAVAGAVVSSAADPPKDAAPHSQSERPPHMQHSRSESELNTWAQPPVPGTARPGSTNGSAAALDAIPRSHSPTPPAPPAPPTPPGPAVGERGGNSGGMDWDLGITLGHEQRAVPNLDLSCLAGQPLAPASLAILRSNPEIRSRDTVADSC